MCSSSCLLSLFSFRGTLSFFGALLACIIGSSGNGHRMKYRRHAHTEAFASCDAMADKSSASRLIYNELIRWGLVYFTQQFPSGGGKTRLGPIGKKKKKNRGLIYKEDVARLITNWVKVKPARIPTS